MDSSQQAIEAFAQKKAGLLGMNLRLRIQQSFAFAYKIYGTDLAPLLSAGCPYTSYIALCHSRDRYAYIDAVLEQLFDIAKPNELMALIPIGKPADTPQAPTRIGVEEILTVR